MCGLPLSAHHVSVTDMILFIIEQAKAKIPHTVPANQAPGSSANAISTNVKTSIASIHSSTSLHTLSDSQDDHIDDAMNIASTKEDQPSYCHSGKGGRPVQVCSSIYRIADGSDV